jgi:hypothetical protein
VVGRVGRGRLRHNSHGRRAVKAPALSMVRDFLRASLWQAGKPACPQSSAWCVGDQSRARPLSVPPESCVPSCRHWSSPGVTLAGLEPGRRSRPHTSPTAGGPTCEQVLTVFGHCSVSVASRPRPVGVRVCGRTGRVTTVACAGGTYERSKLLINGESRESWFDLGARGCSRAREAGMGGAGNPRRGWGGRGAVLSQCGPSR